MSRIALLVATLLVAGCKLIALGDSNTCYAHYAEPCWGTTWPGILQRYVWWRGWRVVNRGVPGMTAGRLSKFGVDARTQRNEYAFSAYHVEKLLTEEHLARRCRWLVVPAFAPVVVVAVGTNDILVRDGETVAADILALVARIEVVAPCVHVFVGLVPPLGDVRREPEIARANARLRARISSERIVDFQSGFGTNDLAEDGIHFKPEAQQKRADAVWNAVWGGRRRP